MISLVYFIKEVVDDTTDTSWRAGDFIFHNKSFVQIFLKRTPKTWEGCSEGVARCLMHVTWCNDLSQN